MQPEVVLGTPFLTLLCPFKVDRKGIKIKYNRQTICFEFVTSIQLKELNLLQDNEIQHLNLIQKKKQHIKFLSKEIHYQKIEENLLQKEIQDRINKIKIK